MKWLERIVDVLAARTFVESGEPRAFIRDGFLHWRVNVRHPGAVRRFSIFVCLVVFLGLACACLARIQFLRSNPEPLVWIMLSVISGMVLFHINMSSVRLDRRAVEYLGFGLIAAGLGFAAQSVLNGLFLGITRPVTLTWMHHLYLGPVAALCQTAGKIIAVALAFRVIRERTTIDSIRIGLCIGLMFTVIEIVSIGMGVILKQIPLHSYIGVWERATASMFHIYSAGLIAAALLRGATGWIIAVWIIHSALDWLAGSAQTIGLHSIHAIETVFTVISLATWLMFLNARPQLTDTKARK